MSTTSLNILYLNNQEIISPAKIIPNGMAEEARHKTTSSEKNLFKGIGEKSLSMAKRGVSTCLGMAKGIVAQVAISTLFGRGESIREVSRIISNPASVQRKVFDASDLYKMFLKMTDYLKRQGFQLSLMKTNPKAILRSACPMEEFYRQCSLASGRNITREVMIKPYLIGFVALPAIGEEILFRGILQDSVLKCGVKKLTQKISPAHASWVDSKVYTSLRILIAAFSFAIIHKTNRVFFPDSYVEAQVTYAFINGIFLGILKETQGLAASIGAHAINNLIAILPLIMAKC